MTYVGFVGRANRKIFRSSEVKVFGFSVVDLGYLGVYVGYFPHSVTAGY